MFASAYFAPTYFAPTYFPPAGLLETIRKGGFALGGIQARRRKLHRELEETEARFERVERVLQASLTPLEIQAIDQPVERELAELLVLKAEADLALLEARLFDLRSQRRNLMRTIEDAFILLLSGD